VARAIAGAAFCAAPRSVQVGADRNRGVNDPACGLAPCPSPCSGVVHASVPDTQFAVEMRADVRAERHVLRVQPSAVITSQVRAGSSSLLLSDSQGASARVKAPLRRCAALTHAVRSLCTALIGAPAQCDRLIRMPIGNERMTA